MKFNLKKENINSKVDEVLAISPLDLKTLSHVSSYIPLVFLTEEILDCYDIEYEYDFQELEEIDCITFVSKSSKILLKIHKDYDLNCSFDMIDYGIIIDSKISFAQRNNLSETFKTDPYCCGSPIDMIIVNMICDELIKNWIDI